MANTLNQLKKMRAQQQTRGENVVAGLLCGVPTTNTEIAAMTGGMAATVVAIELVSPVPMTVVGCIGEAMLGVAAACGLKSAIQGREFWKAAIMGSDCDRLTKEQDKGEDVPDAEKPALDSELRPVRSRVTPWTRTSEQTDEFLRQHGTDQIRLVK